MTKIYVGNLPFSADEAAVRQLFEQHGKVESVALINDRDTGRPRGFGFVEMATQEEAQKAIDTLNGHSLENREIIVNEARPQAPRSSRPSRPGGGGSGPGRRPRY